VKTLTAKQQDEDRGPSNERSEYPAGWSPEKFVSAQEVASHLNVSIRTVRRMTRDGLIPYYHVTLGSIRFRLSEIDECLSRNRVSAKSV
jgi:excisionase family DNA binding protein